METLMFLFLLSVAIYIWYESMRAREQVISHCRRLCNESGFQLLDQTVSLSSLSLKKYGVLSFSLQRVYSFEVSKTGVERLAGDIVLRGKWIIASRLEGPDGSNIFHQSHIH